MIDDVFSLPCSEPFSYEIRAIKSTPETSTPIMSTPKTSTPFGRFEIRCYGTTPYHAAIYLDCTCSLVIDREYTRG